METTTNTPMAPEVRKTLKRLLVVMFVAWCIGDFMLAFMLNIHEDVKRTAYELCLPYTPTPAPGYPLWIFIPAMCVMWRPKWRADTLFAIKRALVDIR